MRVMMDANEWSSLAAYYGCFGSADDPTWHLQSIYAITGRVCMTLVLVDISLALMKEMSRLATHCFL
jgi:hypothetical protein